MSPPFGRVSVCNEDTNSIRKGGENRKVKLKRDRVKSRENSTIITVEHCGTFFGLKWKIWRS